MPHLEVNMGASAVYEMSVFSVTYLRCIPRGVTLGQSRLVIDSEFHYEQGQKLPHS